MPRCIKCRSKFEMDEGRTRQYLCEYCRPHNDADIITIDDLKAIEDELGDNINDGV